jgi:hypothetical protein
MVEGFRRNIESPVPEGYQKIDTLYQELSALGYKNADEVRDFITAAGEDLLAEDLLLEDHLREPDLRITNWRVSDALYAAIQLTIEDEKRKKIAKTAPDHTAAMADVYEKAASVRALSRTLFRTAFPKPLPAWLLYGPLDSIGARHRDIMDQVMETTDPLGQIALLQGGIDELQQEVEKYKAAYEAAQSQ